MPKGLPSFRNRPSIIARAASVPTADDAMPMESKVSCGGILSPEVICDAQELYVNLVPKSFSGNAVLKTVL
jgi:hypothetical protein